ncbi:N-acetyltransferase [Sinomonas halotolerans]|uniref:N-acetyltransferase n=1 Tax=Sinomonas halotolerans TaxID=1644133 RepID=A0ABU9WY04_9MICC
MSGLRVRAAEPRDYAHVARITQAAYMAAGHFPEGHPYLRVLGDVAHRAEHAIVWLGESAGRPVAAVTLAESGQPYSEVAREGEIEFRMLAVDPAAQGAGVGRAMVHRILEDARSRPGIEAVVLTSASHMASAHRLYGSLGFRRLPDRDWSFEGTGEKNLWVFRKDLDPAG